MPKSISQRQYAVKSKSSRAPAAAGVQPRTPAGDAFSALAVQIFRLNGLLLAAGDSLAEPAGQTSARWRVLASVEDNPRPVAQIARMWGLARQSVQRVADELVEDGLAFYSENPNHRRAQLLEPTPAGRAVLRMMQSAQRSWADELGAALGETDLRQVNVILARVLHLLSTRT